MPYTTLISATELTSSVNQANVVILDCRAELTDTRAGAIAYAAGHIPSALHADADLHLSDKSPGPNGEFRGRHPLPSQEAFIQQLRHWGVNSASQVIVYDAHGGMFASRVWWMLRWVGHNDVALLDGGLAAWLAVGGTLVTDIPQPANGNISLRAAITTTVTAADIVNNLATKKCTVLDARDEFPAQKIAGLKIICVMMDALKQLNNYVQNFSRSLAAHMKPYFSAAQVSLPVTMH